VNTVHEIHEKPKKIPPVYVRDVIKACHNTEAFLTAKIPEVMGNLPRGHRGKGLQEWATSLGTPWQRLAGGSVRGSMPWEIGMNILINNIGTLFC